MARRRPPAVSAVKTLAKFPEIGRGNPKRSVRIVHPTSSGSTKQRRVSCSASTYAPLLGKVTTVLTRAPPSAHCVRVEPAAHDRDVVVAHDALRAQLIEPGARITGGCCVADLVDLAPWL